MATIDSTKKLVAVKAYARANALPLDVDSVFDSYAAAETYASTSMNCHPLQVIGVNVDGEAKIYILQADAMATDEKATSNRCKLVPAGMTAEEVAAATKLEWGTIS